VTMNEYFTAVFSKKNLNETRTSCIKCGECCRRNGPALHRDDLYLISEKILDRNRMILLRRGEPVMDNVFNRPQLLNEELIKIRARKSGTWTCFFLDQSNLCSIHNKRPRECRLLECWNPEQLINYYQTDRITRQDLIVSGSAMEELITVHEQRCSVLEIARLLKEEIEDPGKNAGKMNAMLAFDRSFREEFAKKTGTDESELLYYFGRPLGELLRPLSVFLKKNPQDFLLAD